MIRLLDDNRLQAIKPAFSTRNVPLDAVKALDTDTTQPSAGDVLIARVIAPGRLQRLELPTGRKSALYRGDDIMLVYGNRYAPDAYEALLPTSLAPCDLAAAGGLAANVVETNSIFANPNKTAPTRLEPLGLCVGESGKTLNLRDFSKHPKAVRARQTEVICVFGASMNAGKTTTVAGLIRGLSQQGLRVGAAKVTGTCSGGDLWKFQDAGAVKALDFTDGGMATTYLEPLKSIRAAARKLIARLEEHACDVIVLEIADGIHQFETAALLEDLAFRSLVDHWMFAADNAASVNLGLQRCKEYDLEVKAVSGILSASPLALRETMALCDAPILMLDQLESGSIPASWLRPPHAGGAKPTVQQLAG